MHFDKVQFWVTNYGFGDWDDQKAMENFVICETAEVAKPLLAQLYTISQGQYEQETLEKVVGKKRLGKYGTYENWAKLMQMWLLEAQKRN